MLSRRHAVREKHFTIKASHFHRLEKRAKRAILNELKDEWNTGRRRKKPTELVDASTRILMIGSELCSRSRAAWTRWNRDELDWLDSQGVSQEEAMRRHQLWLSQERQNPFWRPARKHA